MTIITNILSICETICCRKNDEARTEEHKDVMVLRKEMGHFVDTQPSEQDYQPESPDYIIKISYIEELKQWMVACEQKPNDTETIIESPPTSQLSNNNQIGQEYELLARDNGVPKIVSSDDNVEGTLDYHTSHHTIVL